MNTLVIIVAVALVLYFCWTFKKTKEASAENIELGEAFLSKNGQINGVTTTASGLQIKQLQAGDGAKHPSSFSRVKVHYHGTLLDGTVFDSSVDRGQPIEFGLNQVIKGWTEGLQLMVEGEKSRLFIPSSLGYGNQKSGKISAGSTLIFEVELLEICE